MSTILKTKRPRRKLKTEWGAAKVTALREHLDLTQAEFAWECGNHNPKGPSVKLLNLVAEKAKFTG